MSTRNETAALAEQPAIRDASGSNGRIVAKVPTKPLVKSEQRQPHLTDEDLEALANKATLPPEVQAHLNDCQDCQTLRDRLRRIHRALPWALAQDESHEVDTEAAWRLFRDGLNRERSRRP